MSKIKVTWLWAVVGLEVAAIIGLLVWGLVLREPEAPPQATETPQNTQPTYKTPKIALLSIATGLQKPVAIAALPDVKDKRLFVAEQDGLIRTVTADKQLDATPFLDLTGKVQSSGEMGLLGLAFHPKATSNHFYVNYIDKQRNTVIARFNINTATGRADPASEKILLKVAQPYTNHNGGHLAFGKDGFLYIGLGDGGSAGDPENRAQDKEDLLGKMLRLDVDKAEPYAIPASNPFANGGGKPEIWAYGLRNPWRFSFDRKTGDLFMADVGQGDYEEIDFQAANSKGGENYGWRCLEGTHDFNTGGCPATSTLAAPIIEYDHSEGRCSVTGGYVYRGSAFPALDGAYVYADFCGGQIYYAQQTAGAWVPVPALTSEYKPATFGEDSAGELYMADYAGGGLYQITDTAN